MSRFNVTSDKEARLLKRMAELGLKEEDLTEQFIRGSGPGGQKRNKTSSSVLLLHAPTGIAVRAQRERSQSVNRFLARRELCDRLEERLKGEESSTVKAHEKVKRQKARRTRRMKAKVREESER
jgi:protein subunit release factor B